MAAGAAASLLLACAAATVAPCEAAHDGPGAAGAVPGLASVATVWCTVTALVLFGGVFKRGERALLNRVPTLGARVVRAMFQELTLLGALGLLLFSADEAGVFRGLSHLLFRDTVTLPAMVRGVDMVSACQAVHALVLFDPRRTARC